MHPGVAAFIAILEDWTRAMEDGSAVHRLPDLDYLRPHGKPDWTDAQLDALIVGIDDEIGQEVKRLPGTSVGADAGPGFSRLDVTQRLALAQELERALEQHREALKYFMPGTPVSD